MSAMINDLRKCLTYSHLFLKIKVTFVFFYLMLNKFFF